MAGKRKFGIEYGGGSYCSVSLYNGGFLSSLETKDWDTAFFERKIGILSIAHEALLKLKNEEIHDILASLVSFADENEFNLIELKCDALSIKLIPFFEEKGFRLVETLIEFLTLYRKPIPCKFTSDLTKIRFATEKDLEEILHLTQISFTNNPYFLSRFKNRVYFTEKETERYYSAWIENHWGQDNCRFVVAESDSRIAGFQSLKRARLHEGVPTYRPLLSAVHPDCRGHNLHPCMISYQHEHIPENEFYQIGRTHLANISMIKQHMKRQMSFSGFEYIFYRSGPM
jgi:hypothetical protein